MSSIKLQLRLIEAQVLVEALHRYLNPLYRYHNPLLDMSDNENEVARRLQNRINHEIFVYNGSTSSAMFDTDWKPSMEALSGHLQRLKLEIEKNSNN